MILKYFCILIKTQMFSISKYKIIESIELFVCLFILFEILKYKNNYGYEEKTL